MRYSTMRCLVIGGWVASVSIFLAGGSATAQDLALPDAPGAGEVAAGAEYEDLSRGPVHEAYAEQFNLDPEPGALVTKRPPESIDELPPEVKPEGDVHFVPGYWAWYEDREDFVWVSGVWRKFPPGRRFVPGYWAEVEGGWRWIPGTWTRAEDSELAYLPEPPASLEAGPTSTAPSDAYFWIPGCWQYRSTRYVWQPGYWSQGYSDWTWIPNRYHWTPRGYIYTAGYWDYPFTHRGLLFAPRYFYSPVYLRAGFRLSARVALAPGRMLYHLFARPHYHHYYFGNYYGPRFASRGYYPWHRVGHVHRHGYDPLWNYYRWHYARRGVNYQGHLDGWHNFYVRNQTHRPAETFRGQAALEQRLAGDRHLNRSVLTASIGNLAALNIATQVRRLDSGERLQQGRMADSFRQIARARSTFERRDTPGIDRTPGADRLGGQRGGPGADANRGLQGRSLAERDGNQRRTRETLKLPTGIADRLRPPSGRTPSGRDNDVRSRLLPGNRGESARNGAARNGVRGRVDSPRGTTPGVQPGQSLRERLSNPRGPTNRESLRPGTSDRTRLLQPNSGDRRGLAPGTSSNGRSSSERRNLLPSNRGPSAGSPAGGVRNLLPGGSNNRGPDIRRGPSDSSRSRNLLPQGSRNSSPRSSGRSMFRGSDSSRGSSRSPSSGSRSLRSNSNSGIGLGNRGSSGRSFGRSRSQGGRSLGGGRGRSPR